MVSLRKSGICEEVAEAEYNVYLSSDTQKDDLRDYMESGGKADISPGSRGSGSNRSHEVVTPQAFQSVWTDINLHDRPDDYTIRRPYTNGNIGGGEIVGKEKAREDKEKAKEAKKRKSLPSTAGDILKGKDETEEENIVEVRIVKVCFLTKYLSGRRCGLTGRFFLIFLHLGIREACVIKKPPGQQRLAEASIMQMPVEIDHQKFLMPHLGIISEATCEQSCCLPVIRLYCTACLLVSLFLFTSLCSFN